MLDRYRSWIASVNSNIRWIGGVTLGRLAAGPFWADDDRHWNWTDDRNKPLSKQGAKRRGIQQHSCNTVNKTA